jgi:hypothetical protein
MEGVEHMRTLTTTKKRRTEKSFQVQQGTLPYSDALASRFEKRKTENVGEEPKEYLP